MAGTGPDSVQEGDAARDLANVRETGYQQDLLQAAGGESEVQAREGESIAARGGAYSWKLYVSQGDAVDLADALGDEEFAVAYAAAEIQSPADQSLLVGLGSDDAVRVWLNGALVHEQFVARPVQMDEDLFPVQLRQGTNRLLIKVVNGPSDWGFAWRFMSPEGLAEQLFAAAASGNAERVERLLQHGVEVDAKSAAGITAAQVAKMRGHDQLADWLVAHGASSPDSFDPASVMTSWLSERAVENAPGIAALVARDGQVLWTGSCGMADLSHDIPITTNTKFRIGSITKQFTAAAILKLQEEGRLSVQDKLSKFMPDFPRGDEVTIHHLLTHTSGIKSYTSKPDFMMTAASAATSEQMINTFKNEPFDFDPGSQFAYNNSGYFLLGAIVEQITGQSYDDYLRDTFFAPLGMHDTGVHHSTAVLKQEATGYNYEQGTTSQAMNWDMSRAGAAGSLYSTVGDLMRWNEGLFGGKVLSSASLQSAFTPVQLPSGESTMMAYGYGWVMGERRGLKTIGHSGGLNGWMSQLTRFVDQNLTVVVLHNGMPPVPRLNPGAVSEWLADAFLWQEMKPQPQYVVDTSVDPATFTAYVGRYDYLSAVMDIQLEEQQLTAQLAGQPRYPIFPMGGDRFFWKVVDAQVKFLRDDKGQVTSVRHTQGGQTFVAKQLPEAKEVHVEADQLDQYTGQYAYPGQAVLTVRRHGEKLLAQMTGQPEFEIFAQGDHVFAWKVVAAEIEFVMGADGQVEKAVHRQSGTTLEAKKIE